MNTYIICIYICDRSHFGSNAQVTKSVPERLGLSTRGSGLPMPLVWVCEVPHLSQRFSVATAGNGAKAYRRLRLPDSAYLDSLLKDADVGFDPDAIPAVKSYTLIGLANIEQGHTFGSPLDIAPNPEADVWLRYFIFPCDGYTVNIRGFVSSSARAWRYTAQGCQMATPSHCTRSETSEGLSFRTTSPPIFHP